MSILEFFGAYFLGIISALAFVWTVTRDGSDDYDDTDGAAA